MRQSIHFWMNNADVLWMNSIPYRYIKFFLPEDAQRPIRSVYIFSLFFDGVIQYPVIIQTYPQKRRSFVHFRRKPLNNRVQRWLIPDLHYRYHQ